MDKTGVVTVNGIPEEHERYVVARLNNGQLWYWCSWDSRDKADDVVAKYFDNGLVIEVE